MTQPKHPPQALRVLPVLRRMALPTVAALATLASVLPGPAAQASVFISPYPSGWPGGRITWLYNPAGRPANITDAEILAAVNASFAAWKHACGVEATYGGLTSQPADTFPTGAYVIGWADFGSAQLLALGGARSSVTSGSFRPFTGGGVRLNTFGDRPQRMRSQLDGNTFVGVLNHEIGHSLGLAHSDEPSSIMFANPYNTDDYFLDLQGDDISACADLYGGKGVIPVLDKRDAVPVATSFSMKASVMAALPTAAGLTPSLAQIDPTSGSTYYFATAWQNLPANSQVVRQTVTPYGSLHTVTPAQQESSSGTRAGPAPDFYRLPFAGRWALQVLVNQQLVASVPFEVTHGQADPVAPFEAAIIGERQTNGALRWRVAPYGRGQPIQTVVVANSTAVDGMSAPAKAGSNSVEVWMETNRPRYKPGDPEGQPAHSFDVMRRASFSAAADGTPQTASIKVNQTGTPSSYAANATLVLNEAADHGVYVAALLGGTLYFRTPAGWTPQASPLVTARGPAVLQLDVLRNFDIRQVPPGTALFVGYGRTLDEVVAKNQYALVRSF